MPKKEIPTSPDQFSFDLSVPAPSLDDVSSDEIFPPTSLPLILDPEAYLAKLHHAMSKRPIPFSEIVDEDIEYEVTAMMKRLYKIWGIPTDAERRAALEESLDETITFLQALPFRDTNAMAYLESHELTYDDIEELRAVLAGQFEIFADLNSSDGYRRHGTVAAFFRSQATEPKTPRKFLK